MQGLSTPIHDECKALLFSEASTAHSFTDEPVTDEQLQAIWDLVKWAPTSMNSLPLRILAVRSPEARQRLVSHMSDSNKGKTLAAPLAVVLAVDSDFRQFLPKLQPFRDHPEQLFPDPVKREHFARFSGALEAGYFIIATRAIGLAAGPMGGFNAEAVDEDFFPDGRWKSIVVVNIGKPSEDAYRPRQPRLDFSEIAATA